MRTARRRNRDLIDARACAFANAASVPDVTEQLESSVRKRTIRGKHHKEHATRTSLKDGRPLAGPFCCKCAFRCVVEME